MKKILLIGAICAATIGAALAQSASPFYKTKSAGGNPATPAETDFLAIPALQARLVSVNYQSDTNNATLQVSTGIGAFAILATNAATSSVTNYINSTNGLIGGSVLFLQHGGAAYIATLSSFNSVVSGTNSAGVATNSNYVVTGSGGFGVATSVGDVVYQMGTPTVIGIGASTNWLNGEAIFVGNTDKPLRVLLTPTSTTNQLPAVTVHYE